MPTAEKYGTQKNGDREDNPVALMIENETYRGMICRKYDNVVDLFSKVAKKFESNGFSVNADLNQLTIEFYNLSEKQEKVLIDKVKHANATGGQTMALIPKMDMYVLYFIRGSDGFAYISNPVRSTETVEMAGTPQLGDPKAYEIVHKVTNALSHILISLGD
jgi:hypothetical protein